MARGPASLLAEVQKLALEKEEELAVRVVIIHDGAVAGDPVASARHVAALRAYVEDVAVDPRCGVLIVIDFTAEAVARGPGRRQALEPASARPSRSWPPELAELLS